jgi:hypothetical protein
MKKLADVSNDKQMYLDPETTQEDANMKDEQLHGKKKKNTLKKLGFHKYALSPKTYGSAAQTALAQKDLARHILFSTGGIFERNKKILNSNKKISAVTKEIKNAIYTIVEKARSK